MSGGGNASPLDLSFYHGTSALLEKFTRMADPSRCGQRLTIENLHDAEDPSFRLRVATFADSHTRNAQAPRAGARVLLNFGAHGRELISSEIALRLAAMLCGEAPSRFAGTAEQSRERIAELLRRVTIKVVPVQVPSSRELAEVGGGSCLQRRLNARGVDVNRNWDVAWRDGDAASRGPRPLSEPETRSLARLASDWAPDVFADVRSGDRYMAMPYASRASGPSNRADRAAMRGTMRAVLSMLERQHPRLLAMGDLPYGPASSLGEEPYKATGTALDYMYSRAGVRRAFMLETYGMNTVYGALGAGPSSTFIKRPPRTGLISFLQANVTGAGTGAGTGAETRAARAARRRRLRRRASAPLVLLSEAEGAASLEPNGEPGSPVDCVGFFNPTSVTAYEDTVNGWADALLFLANTSTLGVGEAGRLLS